MKNLLIHRVAMVLVLTAAGLSGQVDRDSELYRTILALDAAYFEAYNACDLKAQGELLDDDLEFYHDQGGLSTSKDEILQGIRENICGKVTRELIKESVEVHEIKGFGAIEFGLHTFFNNREPEAVPKPSRFITVWKNEEDAWKMHRIISLH